MFKHWYRIWRVNIFQAFIDSMYTFRGISESGFQLSLHYPPNYTRARAILFVTFITHLFLHFILHFQSILLLTMLAQKFSKRIHFILKKGNEQQSSTPLLRWVSGGAISPFKVESKKGRLSPRRLKRRKGKGRLYSYEAVFKLPWMGGKMLLVAGMRGRRMPKDCHHYSTGGHWLLGSVADNKNSTTIARLALPPPLPPVLVVVAASSAETAYKAENGTRQRKKH